MLGFVDFDTLIELAESKKSVPVTSATFRTPPVAVMLPAGMVLTQLEAPLTETSNKTSQELLPAMLAPCRVIVLAPAVAELNTGVPAQLVLAFTGFASVIPAGNGSVIAIFVINTALLLSKRTVTRDLPPEEARAGVKFFVADNDDR